MELWTEYEGRTIDGAYTLTKLIRPEGRSAFFSTSNGTGIPTVIRLIESHFDDEEILARWRGIAALNHANLVKLKKYGQVVLDGTSLVYAVMEPVEANLGEIVRERRLTVLETRQIASSLLSALEALHANGFVHEHVEPANVLAVEETIKLRSDCIREAREGEEGRIQKARDVHDYAVVLLQCLTQQRTLEVAARDLPLASPFDQIVRKGISGEWGLAEIAKVLPPIAAAPPASPSGTAGKSAPVKIAPGGKETMSGDRTPTVPPVVLPVIAATTPAAAARSVTEPSRVASSPASFARNAGKQDRVPTMAAYEPTGLGRGSGRGAGLRAVIGLLAVAVLFLGWHFLHNRSTSAGTAPVPVATPAPILANGAATPDSQTPVGQPVEGEHAPPVENTPPAAAAPRSTGAWRVVAFTYNREGQAREKAASLAARHPNLRPQVFTPSGRAPYLVTLGGGAMSREQAFALSGKAKREGLPRDVYAQNYRGR